MSAWSEFVQYNVRAGNTRPDSQIAGAGGRLHHPVGWLDICHPIGDKRQSRRRAELLEFIHFQVAPGLRWQPLNTLSQLHRFRLCPFDPIINPVGGFRR